MTYSLENILKPNDLLCFCNIFLGLILILHPRCSRFFFKLQNIQFSKESIVWQVKRESGRTFIVLLEIHDFLCQKWTASYKSLEIDTYCPVSFTNYQRNSLSWKKLNKRFCYSTFPFFTNCSFFSTAKAFPEWNNFFLSGEKPGRNILSKLCKSWTNLIFCSTI